jgi:ceramide glucosyltransferase
MMPLARHDYLVLSDSDVRVPPGYLAAVVAPLTRPEVGIVTCPYRGRPGPGVWSRLGSMFIDDWFIPSVRVAALLGSRAFAFGATIGIRREMLERIGGFEAIVNQLADDYRLGELTRQLGARTELSEVLVETAVDERSLRQLADHELRWLRTIRTVRPMGYAFSFVTFGLPVALLACLLSGGSTATLTMLAVTATARVMLRMAHRGVARTASELGLLLLSDALLFTLWCWSFFGRRVRWGQRFYRVARDGSFHPVP